MADREPSTRLDVADPSKAVKKGSSGSGKPTAITPDTLIAEVTDYAIEIASRERAENVQADPDQVWMPKWLAIALILVLVVTAGMAVTLMTSGIEAIRSGGPLFTATLVMIGVSVALVIFTLLLRAERYGRLPDERMKELMALNDRIAKRFEELGSKCYGCGAAYKETFATGAKVCGMDVDKWVAGLNELDLDMSRIQPPDAESKPDDRTKP